MKDKYHCLLWIKNLVVLNCCVLCFSWWTVYDVGISAGYLRYVRQHLSRGKRMCIQGKHIRLFVFIQGTVVYMFTITFQRLQQNPLRRQGWHGEEQRWKLPEYESIRRSNFWMCKNCWKLILNVLLGKSFSPVCLSIASASREFQFLCFCLRFHVWLGLFGLKLTSVESVMWPMQFEDNFLGLLYLLFRLDFFSLMWGPCQMTGPGLSPLLVTCLFIEWEVSTSIVTLLTLGARSLLCLSVLCMIHHSQVPWLPA